MKNYKFPFVLIAFFVMAWASTSLAQFDDLYYNPDTDDDFYTWTDDDSSDDGDYVGSDDYDDAEYGYEEDDEYDYYYSSRIRRFYRPYYGFSFYDPVYVDAYYYNPIYSFGNSTYIYSNSLGYRSNPWNRYYSYNSFGYGPGYSPYNNYYGYGGNPYGYGYGGGGYSSYSSYAGGYNPYCPPAFSNPYSYTTTSYGSTDNVYYGTRNGSTGTSRNSPRGGPSKFDNLNSGSNNTPSARGSRNSGSDVYDVSGSSRKSTAKSSRSTNRRTNSNYNSSRSSKTYDKPSRSNTRTYSKPSRNSSRSSTFGNSRNRSKSSSGYNRSSNRNSSRSSASPSRSSSSKSSSGSRSSSRSGGSRGPR